MVEGARLFNWAHNQNTASLQDKLKHRKSALKTFVANERGVEPYQGDLESVMRFTCSKCSIQGPLTRGGRYIDEKLSNADKSVFLKLLATYQHFFLQKKVCVASCDVILKQNITKFNKVYPFIWARNWLASG